jgi:hypothetical protein
VGKKAKEKREKRISLPFDYTQGKLTALRVNSEAYCVYMVRVRAVREPPLRSGAGDVDIFVKKLEIGR